jgi:multidrug efflux system outer membrane protein
MSMKHEWMIGAALLALTAGCSLQPVYNRPAAPVSAAYPTAPGQDATPHTDENKVQAKKASQVSQTGWQDFMQDPALQRLVKMALQNNRDMRVAALNVEKTQAQYRLQRSALFPQVDVAVQGSNTRGITSTSGNKSVISHQYDAGLSASWEMDFFGRLHSLSDAALQQFFASEQARRASEILLISQVADQYLTMIAYDEQLVVTDKTLDANQEALRIVQLQFQTGVASELDVRLSETALEQAQINRVALVRSRAQAENALVLLIGRSLPADLPAPSALAAQAILADIPAGLPSDLLQNRPDILESEALLKAENANIGAARAAFFPNISLTGSYGVESATLGNLLSGAPMAWSLVPSLIAPIFDAGANRANLDVAKLQKDIGIAQYEKSIQTAFREVADGLAARTTYNEQLAAQQRYTDTQARRLQLATMLYQAGTGDYLNVLTAQTDFYNAQQGLITTRLNRLTSIVDLYRALGGGWAPADSGKQDVAHAADQG